MPELAQGNVVWAWLDPTVGREQSGRRPVLVVSSDGYNAVVTSLAIVVPISATDRGWPNHVAVTGVEGIGGFAMTEQPRAVSRERLGDRIGNVDADCLLQIKRWLGDFLDLP